jgi:hypothetical protein
MIIAGLLCQSIKAQVEDPLSDWQENTAVIWESLDLTEKLNLNRASLAEMQQSGFTAQQSQCMIQHREIWGEWTHETELQQCGISVAFIRENRSRWTLLLTDARRQYLQEHKGRFGLPKIKLLSNRLTHEGNWNPSSHQTQIQASWGNWSRLGYVIQTDAGERLGDFQSAAWEFKSMKTLKHLIVGRFLWNWNQGLVFAAPFAVGRSFDMGYWVYNSQELRPAISANEDQGIWGLGSRWQLGKNEVFFSIGATPFDTRLNDEGNAFTKRHYGGLHVSNLEKSRRHNNVYGHIFMAWQRHFPKHSINISHTHYRYATPREAPQKRVQSEHITEYQHTFKKLLGGRMLINIAASNQGYFSYYAAGAWSLNTQLDLSLKTQSIPEYYYAPERSPYTQSDNAKSNSEMGFDYKPNRNTQLQIRSILENDLKAFEYSKIKTQNASWVLQYLYHLNRNDFIQVRWKSPYTLNGHNPPQLMLQSKFSILSKYKLRLVYVQQKEAAPQWNTRQAYSNSSYLGTGSEMWGSSTAILIQIGIKLGGLNLQCYGGTFNTTSPLYITLPSAQFPWRLGIFTGEGYAAGMVVKHRIHKRIRLLYSIDYIKKKSFVPTQSQKPRIFVQLEIL